MTGNAIQNKSLVSIGLVIICAAAAFYIYNNMLPSYNNAKAQQQQLQNENQKLKTALNSLQQFMENYEEVSRSASNVNLFLPTDNSDVANFINNLSELAQSSGVVLAGFQIAEGSQKGLENSIQSVDIGFSSSGSYASLKELVSKLQNNMRLMDIQSISVNSAQAGAGTPILEFQIKLKTYFQQ